MLFFSWFPEPLVGQRVLRRRRGGALRLRSRRQRGRLDAGAGQRPVELLAPVRDISGRPVAVQHRHRGVAGVGKLVENARRDEHGLAGGHGLPLIAQAHLADPIEDDIHFFLLLIVPGHLSAARLQHDVAEAEVRRLDRRGSPHQVARAPPGRIRPPFDPVEIGDPHPGNNPPEGAALVAAAALPPAA
jgi:hypothetical protein